MGSQRRNPLPLTRVDAEARRRERSGLGNRPSWCHLQVSSLQLRSLLHWTTRSIPIGSWWPELVQKLRIGRSCSGEKSHHLCRSCVHPPSLHREDSEGGVLDAVERWRRHPRALLWSSHRVAMGASFWSSFRGLDIPTSGILGVEISKQ